jgi:hypothetical protein
MSEREDYADGIVTVHQPEFLQEAMKQTNEVG